MAAPRQKIEREPVKTPAKFLFAAPLTKAEARALIGTAIASAPITVLAAQRSDTPKVRAFKDSTGIGHPAAYYGTKQRHMNMDRAR